MKKAFTILFLILGLTSVYSQSDTYLIPFRKGKKWSIAKEDGTILFKPKYQQTYPSMTSRIRFCKKNKYGFLDLKGKTVIKPIYEQATDYYVYGGQTHSFVSIRDTSFYIDKLGITIQPINGCGEAINNYLNGIIIFENEGKFGLKVRGDTVINAILKSVKNYYNGVFVIAQNFENKFGLVHENGEIIYDFKLDSVVYDRSNNRYPIYKIYEKGKVGFITPYGIIHALPKYDDIKPIYFKGLYTCIAYINGEMKGYVYKQREFWE